MKTLQFRSHVGTDGVLTLRMPTDLAGTELDVLVVVSEVDKATPLPPIPNWQEFITRTSGSIADPTFDRPSQGEYEARDALG